MKPTTATYWLLILTSLCYSQILDPIQITVSTDKNNYQVGETIQIVVSACNSSPMPVPLSWVDGCQATYWIDGIRKTLVCIQIQTSITIEPYSCHTWDFTDSINQEGLHSIEGEVIGYGNSSPVYITVSMENFPPVFSASLPDTGFAEDESLLVPFAAWFDYVEDPDDPGVNP